FQRPAALVDKEQLVALSVAIEVAHRFGWPRHGDDTIVVVHQQMTPLDGIAALWGIGGLKVMVPVLLLLPLVATDAAVAGDLAHPRRRMLMIEQRFDAAESLLAKQLLGIEAAVGLAKLCVSLVGNRPHRVIERHGRDSLSPRDCR